MVTLLRQALAILCALAVTSATPVSDAAAYSALRVRSPLLADCLANRNVPIRAIGEPLEPFNLRLVYTPAAIVLPTTTQHISDAVICAKKTRTKVQPKSGGHSYGSYSSGGQNGSLVVDLESWQEIKVDNVTGIAKVGGGVRLGNLALGIYNQSRRGLPHGTCPGVGIGGHITHGGYGYTSRNWGLALDTIVAMDVVLADGSSVRTTNTSYPDLYYALRGAADSFGIVTTFYVQTQPAPTSVINFMFSIPAALNSKESAADAFLHIQNVAMNASVIDRRISFGVTVAGSPQGPTFSILGTFFGSLDEFNTKISPELLRKLPTPAMTRVNELDWIASLTELAGGPLEVPITGYDLHNNFFAKSIVTEEAQPLTRPALESWFDYAITRGRNTTVAWFSTANLYGGPGSQINARDPETFAAYTHRDSLWVFQNYGYVPDDQPFTADAFAFVEGLNNALSAAEPGVTYDAYLNYLDPSLPAEEAHRVYYGEDLYRKLLKIKRRVDPKRVFWNPQAVGA